MINFKYYLIALLISFSIFVSAHLVPLLVVDPLNILSFDITSNEFYIKEMRFQSAPIINKFEFDSVITGTSMAENFQTSEANNVFESTFLNLSLSGSLLLERKILLDYLLAKKNIKTVIMSIDNATTIQRNKGISLSSWSILYNNNYLDDFSLYTNRKYSTYINCHSVFKNELFKKMYGECPKSNIRKKVENLTEWQTNPKHYNRFGGINKWLKYKGNSQIKRSITEINTASNLIKLNKVELKNENIILYDSNEFLVNILPIIKNNPKTNFILFFPPYSIFQYAIDMQTKPHTFKQYKKLVEYVVLETNSYSNVEIHWFGNRSFVKDIKNYKDLTHIHGKFNSVFLQDFKSKKSIINIGNYKNYILELEKDARSIDLVDLSNKLSSSDK